jgi:prepilin-type N-terminal cleavage/methylation domain-containing protein
MPSSLDPRPSSLVPRPSTLSRRGFTLVELLTVIGILIVMMMYALPAFTGLAKGSGMQAAVSELRSTLSLARQWAVTHRETTYVVFPDDSVVSATSTNEMAMAFRAYNVFGSKSGYVGEWKYLPAGVYFMTQDSNCADLRATKNPLDQTSASYASVPFPSITSTTNLLPAVKFQTDGRANSFTTGSDAELFLGECYLTDGTPVGYPVWKGSSGNAMAFGVFVYKLTGGVRVTDYNTVL